MHPSRSPHAGKSFRLITLGSVTLVDASGVTVAEQRRRLALLALIASGGTRGVSRDKLIAILSPESPAESARHALHQLLYYLRQQVGDDLFLGTDPLRLNPELVDCDASEFEAAIEAGAMDRAAALYRGPFLDGFHLGESTEFEDWAMAQRARLAALHAEVLLHLARRAGERGDHASAVTWWSALAAKDPLNGSVALDLVQALAASGDRTGALRQALNYQVLVRDELAMEPDAAIESFMTSLRAMPPPDAASPVLPRPISATLVPASSEPLRSPVRPLRPPLMRLLVGAMLLVSVALIASSRATPEVGDRSVAIMPLENGAGDSLDFLVDGLANTMVRGLNRVPGLRVVGDQVMRQYEGSDLGALGRRVGVTALLTGRLEREQDTLKLMVEVVRSGDGARLARGKFVIDARRIVAVESDLITAVVQALGVTARQGSGAPPKDGEAALLVWRADHFMLNRDTASLRRARDLLNEAIERDPAFADAHVGLSGVYGAFAHYGLMPSPKAFALAEAAARRGLQLDPQSARALANLAQPLGLRFYRWEESLRDLQRAADMEPWRASTWNLIGTVLRRIGRFDESVAAFRRAQALDPLSRHFHYQVAHAFRCAGRQDSALATIRDALALGATYPAGHELAADILRQMGRSDAALGEWRTVAEQTGDTVLLGALGGVHGTAGLEQFLLFRARLALRALDALPPHLFTSPTVRAELYATVGDADRAFAQLQKALEDRDPSLSGITCSMAYEPLRQDPRFLELMRVMHLTPAAFGVIPGKLRDPA